jgi:hypothetical protein
VGAGVGDAGAAFGAERVGNGLGWEGLHEGHAEMVGWPRVFDLARVVVEGG